MPTTRQASNSVTPLGEADLGVKVVWWVLFVLLGTSVVVIAALITAPPSVTTFHIVEAGAWLSVIGAGLLAFGKPQWRPPLLLIAVLTALFVISPPGGWFDRCCPKPTWGGSDGAYYWEAGQRVALGQDPWAGSGSAGYLYPPPLAELFAFMSRGLSPERALGAWTWVILAAYIMCITGTYSIALRRSGSDRTALTLTAALWLVNRPAIVSASDHQVNLPLLALLLLAWIVLETRPVLAAILISISGLVKISPLGVGAAAAIVRWRWLLVFVPVLVGVLSICYLMAPGLWQLYAGYAGQLVMEPRGVSLDVLTSRVLPTVVAEPVTFLLKLALVAWATWVVVRRRNEGITMRHDIAFAVALWSMAVLPSTVWSHYFIWFTPALLVCWLYAERRIAAFLGALTVAALWMPLMPPPLGTVWLISIAIAIMVVLQVYCTSNPATCPGAVGQAIGGLLDLLSRRAPDPATLSDAEA